MSIWWSRQNFVQRLIAVASTVMAVLSFYMASRISNGLALSNFLFIALGTGFLSAALSQGARGSGMLERIRNAPLLAHHLSGASIAIALCGLVLMHFGQIGP